MKFEIDDAVTIGSILNALKVEGVKVSDIAKTINGISEKPLRRALKLAGYEYQNKAPKGWRFVGDGEEPLNDSVFGYVKRNSPKVHPKVTRSNTKVTGATKDELKFTQSNPHITQGETEFTPTNTNTNDMQFAHSNMNVTEDEVNVNSHVIHPQFTQDETRMLLEMLHEWKQKKLGAHQISDQSVHERIKALSKDDKVRKTIVIDRTIADRLDDYSKYEKVNKSDIIHLALIDFFKKYDE